MNETYAFEFSSTWACLLAQLAVWGKGVGRGTFRRKNLTISVVEVTVDSTLPETNIAHGNPIFPCKYHQNGGFSWAMLVLGRVYPETIHI